jgi:hypothetical protein
LKNFKYIFISLECKNVSAGCPQPHLYWHNVITKFCSAITFGRNSVFCVIILFYIQCMFVFRSYIMCIDWFSYIDMHSSVLQQIWLLFMALWFCFQFFTIIQYFGFPKFSVWARLKRHDWSKCTSRALQLVGHESNICWWIEVPQGLYNPVAKSLSCIDLFFYGSGSNSWTPYFCFCRLNTILYYFGFPIFWPEHHWREMNCRNAIIAGASKLVSNEFYILTPGSMLLLVNWSLQGFLQYISALAWEYEYELACQQKSRI